MICKYCGKTIDPAALNCPSCGKAIRREGGNGFWDMAVRPYPPASSAAQPAPTMQQQNPPQAPYAPARVVTKQSPWPILIGAALCLIGVVLFAAGKISNSREVNKLKKDILRLESQLVQANESRSGAADLQIDERQENGEDEQQTEPAEETLPPEPTQDPTAGTGDYNVVIVEKQRGYAGELFTVDLEEAASWFQWLKLGDDGNYSEIPFEENSSEEFGLTLSQDPDNGISSLAVKELTEKCAGKYLCKWSAESGDGQRFFTLTVDGAEEKPDPKEQQIPGGNIAGGVLAGADSAGHNGQEEQKTEQNPDTAQEPENIPAENLQSGTQPISDSPGE